MTSFASQKDESALKNDKPVERDISLGLGICVPTSEKNKVAHALCGLQLFITHEGTPLSFESWTDLISQRDFKVRISLTEDAPMEATATIRDYDCSSANLCGLVTRGMHASNLEAVYMSLHGITSAILQSVPDAYIGVAVLVLDPHNRMYVHTVSSGETSGVDTIKPEDFDSNLNIIDFDELLSESDQPNERLAYAAAADSIGYAG